MSLFSTVAVIGGADGPTAVFLTGSSTPLIAVGALILSALVGAAAALIYCFLKKK